MYIVTVQHETPHGPRPTPICVTGDPVRALRAAITAENLGYRFGDYSGTISIHRLENDITYAAKQNKEQHRVFARLRFDGKWTDNWDDEFRNLIKSRL